jgi:hypothetical protein
MLHLNQHPKVLKNRYKLLQVATNFKTGLQTVLCFALCLGGLAESVAQNRAFEGIARDLGHYRQHALQEKLFLHLDRPVYGCGETMWFKVYNVDGTLHRPLDMSKVAYVEVLDVTQSPVLQAKVTLKEGIGNGSFALPTTLSSGNYTVRAYTNWMKNFSPEFYFEQPITIVNTFRSIEPVIASKTAGYSIQFFPEGGNMVAGVANKVAFKAIDEKTGKGINFEGDLLDQRGNVVATFKPHRFGIGHFAFTPAQGQTYTARLKAADGQSFSHPLPKVYEQGYTLHLEEAGTNQLKLTVNQVGMQGEQVYLLGHTRQVIAVSEAATVNQGIASFLVDKKMLGDGITHFTVFNDRQQPVCERLYFKQPAQLLQLNVATNKPQYSIREKVTLDLLTPSNGSAANLSLAVYKLDSLQGAVSSSIESYLWLSSDLKGNIEHPVYYFSGTGASDREAMDNLMLTHGWSRFKWDEMLGKTVAAHQYLPEYNGHWVTGKVTHKATGKPMQGITAYLASPGKHPRFYNAKSDAEGLVRFEVKDLFGSKDIVMQTDFRKDSTYHFEIFNPFSEKYAGSKLATFHLSEQLQQDLTMRHLQVQVQHAYMGGYSNRFSASGLDSVAFYGAGTEQYLLDDYKRFKVMEEVMREYVPGVQVRKQGGSFRFMVFDRPYKTIFQQNPMVLLDGVPVFNIDKIMAFDPLKVKKLDVVTSRYFHGPLVYDGLVSYTTYTGDLAGFELDSRSLLQAYEGLQQQREFYAPRYETEEQQRSRLADFRNLLYWAPEVRLEANQNGTVNFYTSDQVGTYLVVIQGITENGVPGSQVATFRVEQPLVME